MSDWIKTSDQLPCPLGEQANVIFASPLWGWPLVGLFTHFENPEDGRWSYYDQVRDRYILWDSKDPTHWMLMPSVPKEA